MFMLTDVVECRMRFILAVYNFSLSLNLGTAW